MSSADKLQDLSPQPTPPVDEVWVRWRTSGDLRLRDELITGYLPLVKRVAGRLFSTLPPHLSIDDLYSTGITGLIKAVDQFDEEKKTKFESYAILLIRGAIIDELRRQNWAPRTVYQQSVRVAEVQRELENELGRQASDEEMADRLEVTPEEFGDLLEKIRPTLFVRLNADEGEGSSLAERIADGRALSAADTALRQERKKLLEERVRALPEQERKVLTLYYYDELMLREIGELMGISESRVSQIHTKALIHLRLAIDEVREEFRAD
jgi:RNA polymerase sigma factor FliA